MLWLLRLLNPLVIAIRGGKTVVVKGRLPSPTLRALREEIAGADLERGTIHADGTGRIHFSGDIPVEIRQRLRNILAAV